jgi:hypothetical protein
MCPIPVVAFQLLELPHNPVSLRKREVLPKLVVLGGKLSKVLKNRDAFAVLVTSVLSRWGYGVTCGDFHLLGGWLKRGLATESGGHGCF